MRGMESIAQKIKVKEFFYSYLAEIEEWKEFQEEEIEEEIKDVEGESLEGIQC